MKVRPKRQRDTLRFLVLVLLGLAVWQIMRLIASPVRYRRTHLGSVVDCRVSVSCSSPWQGSYGDLRGSVSWQGTGRRVARLAKAELPISVSAKKMASSRTPLTVSIEHEGVTVATKTTTAPHGVVELAWTGGEAEAPAAGAPLQEAPETPVSGLAAAARSFKSSKSK